VRAEWPARRVDGGSRTATRQACTAPGVQLALLQVFEHMFEQERTLDPTTDTSSSP
jgi:hypothetical protein